MGKCYQMNPPFVKAILLLSIIIFLIGCKREEQYKIDTITFHTNSVVQIDGVKADEVRSAKDYAEFFLNSYLNTLRSVVPFGFHDGLPLLETNVSVRLIFSEQAECFFHFYPSDKNELIIEYTELPAQLVLFDKTGLDGSNLNDATRSFLPYYKDWIAPMEIDSVACFQYLSLGSCVPLFPAFRYFKLNAQSTVGINEVAFENTNIVTHIWSNCFCVKKASAYLLQTSFLKTFTIRPLF